MPPTALRKRSAIGGFFHIAPWSFCLQNNLTLRPATIDDLDALFTLLQRMAAEDALSDDLLATPDRIKADLFGPNPSMWILLVCTPDGTAVGYTAYYRTCSTYLARPGLWIDDIFVVPDWRGQGIGQMLFSALARRVVEMNGGRLEWHVNLVNERARTFYERNGAEVLDAMYTLRLSGDALKAAASG